jgi:FkbM family methyltransferase
MSKDTPYRSVAKKVRDHLLWRTPGLQGMIRDGAQRGRIPSAIWRKLHPRGVWILHTPDGVPFFYDSAHPGDGLARHIVWTDMRDWEPTTQPVLYSLARQARVFVDVGAYSGIYTILACLAAPDLRAVAIEPNPERLLQLDSNIALNGLQDRVTVIGEALSDRPGTACLAIPRDDSQASLSGPAHGDRCVEVPVTTGDQILTDLPVDLIKIDVEGHEPAVLRGMAGVIGSRRPRIIAECLDQVALERMMRQAAEFGYRHAYHIDDVGLVPVQEGFTHPLRYPNYLFSAAPVTVGETAHGTPVRT